MRNIYKDFITLVDPGSRNRLTTVKALQAKGEPKYEPSPATKDQLIDCTRDANGKLGVGRQYREERDMYQESNDLQLSFYFLTRTCTPETCRFIRDYMRTHGSYPDIMIINSALWDINRWGPRGIEYYHKDVEDLMRLLKSALQPRTQVIWMTTPPISVDIRSGLLIKDTAFQRHSMRFNIMEANQCAANIVAAHGFDVLDMHYHFYHQVHRRAADGIHWNPDAVRMQTNIILTHISLSRGMKLPGNYNKFTLPGIHREKSDTAWNLPLNKAIQDLKLAEDADKEEQPKIEEPRRIAVPKRKFGNKAQQ